MINMLSEIFILALAIPAGLLISWLARDELAKGRKWFASLFIIFILAAIWFYLTGIYLLVWASLFIGIIAFVSYMKSFDKNWIKRFK